MKVIGVGLGKVGWKLVELLSNEEGHEVTAIDTVAKNIRNVVGECDIMGIVGNGTNIECLAQAGVKEADLLIAVTGSDEVNLLTCLIAKKAGNCKTIARVRQREYVSSLGLIKDELGLEMAINPEQAAATEIARVLRFPSAIQIDTFSKGRVEILKFRIPESSPLDEIRVADMAKRINCDILVCGVERGENVFIPGGNFILRAGDLVSFVATPKNATDFFNKIGFKTNSVKDTLIIGGGATAYYLAVNLLQSGVKVKIIEQDQARCEELCEILPKATIICGDGTDTDLLEEEHLSQYESVVALTGIDEENIMLTLFAKTQTDGKLVTKINRISYDSVIGGLGLDTTINPNNITAEYIARYVRATYNSLEHDIETMHMILDNKAEALEFRIHKDSPVANMTLEEISLKENVIIACINRNGKIIIPRGKDTILTDDRVIAVTTSLGVKSIKEILK